LFWLFLSSPFFWKKTQKVLGGFYWPGRTFDLFPSGAGRERETGIKPVAAGKNNSGGERWNGWFTTVGSLYRVIPHVQVL
jgi:hypothetical protein